MNLSINQSTSKTSSLHTALGITDGRKQELHKIMIESTFASEVTAVMLQKTAEKCSNLEEVAYCAFVSTTIVSVINKMHPATRALMTDLMASGVDLTPFLAGKGNPKPEDIFGKMPEFKNGNTDALADKVLSPILEILSKPGLLIEILRNKASDEGCTCPNCTERRKAKQS